VSSSTARRSAWASGQLGLQRRDPRVEEIDELQALADRAAPDLGQAGALEHRQAIRPAQARERDAHAPPRLQAEDAALGARAEADQVHPPAQAFP
jgi:hypothetical protein